MNGEQIEDLLLLTHRNSPAVLRLVFLWNRELNGCGSVHRRSDVARMATTIDRSVERQPNRVFREGLTLTLAVR